MGRARKAAVTWLRDRQVDERVVDDAALVVSELSANAVEASPAVTFELRLELTGAALGVTVENEAALTDLPDRADWGPRSPLDVRGRGLSIVDALARQVDTSERDGRLVITAVLQRG